MSIYARISDGFVCELFAPPSGVAMSVLFPSTLQWVDVTSISPQPQPGWSATETNGAWTFTAPIVVPPTPAQQASALLNAGLVLTSSSTPALDGTYAATSEMKLNLMAELMSWQVNGKFTNGSTIKAWPLLNGGLSTIASQAQLQEVMTQIGSFVDACEVVIGGQSTILPSNTVAIA